jgi:DNA end-binding protein Ku
MAKRPAPSSRPLWRGHLKLSLVSCPIALYNAITETEEIHLHFLNPETGNRIRYQSVDAETQEVIDRTDLVRGYEFQKDRYVTLTNEELDDLKIESSTVMNVEEFVDAGDIDPRYFERAYYVVPDGEAGSEAYTVIRAAMAKSGRFAITRAVIARKERVIAMRPFGKGIIGYALREEAEVRSEKDFFRDIGDTKIDKDALDIAMKLVQQKTAKFDPARFDDRYESRLRQLIDAKLKGVELEPEEIAEAPKVVNLLDALRRSLNEGKRKPSNDNEGRKGATVHKFERPKTKKRSVRVAAPKKKTRRRA